MPCSQMKKSLGSKEDERDMNKAIALSGACSYWDPIITDAPVSPNVKLKLVQGAIGGLLLSTVLALPLLWFLHRKNSTTH